MNSRPIQREIPEWDRIEPLSDNDVMLLGRPQTTPAYFSPEPTKKSKTKTARVFYKNERRCNDSEMIEWKGLMNFQMQPEAIKNAIIEEQIMEFGRIIPERVRFIQQMEIIADRVKDSELFEEETEDVEREENEWRNEFYEGMRRIGTDIDIDNGVTARVPALNQRISSRRMNERRRLRNVDRSNIVNSLFDATIRNNLTIPQNLRFLSQASSRANQIVAQKRGRPLKTAGAIDLRKRRSEAKRSYQKKKPTKSQKASTGSTKMPQKESTSNGKSAKANKADTRKTSISLATARRLSSGRIGRLAGRSAHFKKNKKSSGVKMRGACRGISGTFSDTASKYWDTLLSSSSNDSTSSTCPRRMSKRLSLNSTMSLNSVASRKSPAKKSGKANYCTIQSSHLQAPKKPADSRKSAVTSQKKEAVKRVKPTASKLKKRSDKKKPTKAEKKANQKYNLAPLFSERRSALIARQKMFSKLKANF